MDNQIENLEGEIWKDVLGYEGLYQVSNLSRIKSLSRYCGNRTTKNKILRHRDMGKGYFHVSLCTNSVCKNKLVHRLVAIAFIPRIDGKDYINHINNITTDNRIENLEWCTISENTLHSYTSRIRKGASSKLTDDDVRKIRVLWSTGTPTKELAKMFNISKRGILHAKNYKTYKRVI